MRQTERFDYQCRAGDVKEAMLAASHNLVQGRRGLKSGVLTAVITALCAIGGAVIMTIALEIANFDSGWWAMFGGLLGAGLYLASFRWLYSEMANQIMDRPLNRAPQTIEFSQAGMTYAAGPARWSTPWAMIDDVVETPLTLTVVISGIAFGLPKDAIGREADVALLLADLKAQIAGA